jgi:hypothetical protein
MARRSLEFTWAVCAVALTLPLASCVSPEELRREEATCTGYGFHAQNSAPWQEEVRPARRRDYLNTFWPPTDHDDLGRDPIS